MGAYIDVMITAYDICITQLTPSLTAASLEGEK